MFIEWDSLVEKASYPLPCPNYGTVRFAGQIVAAGEDAKGFAIETG